MGGNLRGHRNAEADRQGRWRLSLRQLGLGGRWSGQSRIEGQDGQLGTTKDDVRVVPVEGQRRESVADASDGSRMLTQPEPENLVAAYTGCNTTRDDRPLEAWLAEHPRLPRPPIRSSVPTPTT